MEIQFFLKHQFIKELMQTYGFAPLDPGSDPAAEEYKGLIFSMSFDIGAGSYVAKGRVEIAKGKPDPATGRLPVIDSTLQILCPHPPPCELTGEGEFVKDTQGNLIIDKANPAASCYLDNV